MHHYHDVRIGERMPQPLAHEPVAIFLTIMAVILVTPLLSEWLHLPDIAGLIMGGLLVGPHGLNLLSASRTIELLSTVGLIYLMFSAGLEIDLYQFNQVKNKPLVFGAMTFAIPEISGVFLGRAIGLDWLGAVLLGSVYASHTLVAFPILSRLGILKNEAVSVTVGATVMTDISALLVLAIIAGTAAQPGATFVPILALVAGMAGYTLLILLGLPRLGKAFFKRFTGRVVEFQFVLVVVFVAALLAEQIGMHAIVGAFLAGLAINSTLPPRSRVIVNVAQEVQGRVHGLDDQRKLMDAEILNDPETEIHPIRRVDSSPAQGILRAAIENEITLIVMGWRGKPTFRQSIFGTLLDEVVWDSQVPVLVGRLNTPINAMQRIALVIPPDGFSNELADRTLDVALAIAGAINVPLLLLAAGRNLPILQRKIVELETEHPYSIEALGKNLVAEAVARLQNDDLIVATAIGSPGRFRSSLGYIPEQLAAAKEGSIVVIHYP
jgi:nucleotide-binding universal stress UspA family protein